MTALDSQVTNNTTAISNLQGDIESGNVGLVRQDGADGVISVAASSGGDLVSLAGTDGNRRLAGVSAGAVSASSTDAINGSQFAAGGQSIAAALGGGTGVNLDGTLSAPSYALNGVTYNNVGGAVGALQDQINNINTNGVTGIGVNTTLAAASASGVNSVALGGGSVASGEGAFAGGSGSVAAGQNASAIGNGASAGFLNSTAIGAGATTTREGQFALGTSDNTYTFAGIASNESRAAQTGPLQIVTSDAEGNLGTADIASFFPGIDGLADRLDGYDRKHERQSDGIAIAMALSGAYLPQDKDFAVSGNVGFFDGNTALGVAGVARLDDNWAITGGVGVGFERTTVAGRVGATFAW